MMNSWKKQDSMPPKKIIIFGFPHCGTTILKSILGHINDIEEILGESSYCFGPNGIKTTTKKYVVCKTPYVYPLDSMDKYKDYIMIFIIRNPLFVFSSLNKRFKYNIPPKCNYDKYIYTIKKFINCSTNTRKNVYTIRYEDLFTKHKY